MRETSSSVWRLGRYFLFTYTILSLVFTVKHFYMTSGSTRHQAPTSDMNSGIHPRAGQDILYIGSEHTGAQQIAQSWSNSQGTAELVSESNLKSKLFSSALGPSTVKPYYYKARHLVNQKDITLSTLVTRNRFPVLGRLASHYKGPISAAIHINDDTTKDQVMKELDGLFDSNPDVRQYVDVHLIIDPFDRQFNLWRNVAKLYARTDYIMMLDVDFYLCTDFRHRILSNPSVLAKLDAGRTALVVPAFEYLLQDDGLDAVTFPTHKTDLIQQVQQDRIDMFHKSWLNGHGATNYSHWYASSDLYKVTDYNFSYEPYVIFKKDGAPWCDERFIGYGANKAACLYEIYLAGLEYWVLPDDFLIHQTHSYPEDTRRKERQYNRKLYSNFREELCLRYSRKYMATGEWDTARSDNLKKECQKIRGYRSAV